MNNIFADYGSIISSERYIHRTEAEKIIYSRLLEHNQYGSISLVGMQRIGKSSLANDLIVRRKESLLNSHVLTIHLVLYNYKSVQSFFMEMVDQAYDALADMSLISQKVERAYQRAKQSSVEDTGGEKVRLFFKAIVSDLSYRIICVIDEFDYVRTLFKDYPQGFFVLRELAYQPENKIGFLFLSRRLMSELESSSGFDVSNFEGILVDCYLAGYSDAELDQYFSIFKSIGIDITDELREQFIEITGRMPMWMDILSFYYCDSILNGAALPLTEIYYKNEDAFISEYKRMFNLLEDQNLLNALYQVVLGPIGDEATPQRIRRLLNYGIIQKSEHGYRTISKYFREYMVMLEQSVEFYPLWNRTEKLLRLVGTERFSSVYGENWEDKLFEMYPAPNEPPQYKTAGQYLVEAKELISRMQSKGLVYEISIDRANILDGLTTGGLAEVICAEYNKCGFMDVFSMKKGVFKKLMEEIIWARNPYEHNNDHFLRDDFKKKTQVNLAKLSKLMEAYLKLS